MDDCCKGAPRRARWIVLLVLLAAAAVAGALGRAG